MGLQPHRLFFFSLPEDLEMEDAYERVMRYASEAVDNGNRNVAVTMLSEMRDALQYCNESTKRVMGLNDRMGADPSLQDSLHRECTQREFKILDINRRLEHPGA